MNQIQLIEMQMVQNVIEFAKTRLINLRFNAIYLTQKL